MFRVLSFPIFLLSRWFQLPEMVVDGCTCRRDSHLQSRHSRPRRRGAFAIALALLAGVATAAPRQVVDVRLIGINDLHGNLEPANLSLSLADPASPGNTMRVPVGGMANLAGLIEALRLGASHSVTLSAGDMIGAAPLISTLFRHESTVDMVNVLGLQAGAVGNHEFDAGIVELQRIVHGGCAPNRPQDTARSCRLGVYGGMRFPLLGANVLDSHDRPALPPSTVRTIGGVRIGIIGTVTHSVPSIVMPSGIAGLHFVDEADAVNREARALGARGVHAIVAVFHEGGELGTSRDRGDWNNASCPDAHGPIFGIAKRLRPEISVVFSAHTHQGYRCLIDGRTIIQGTSFGRGVSVIDIRIDRRTGKILPAETKSFNLPVFSAQVDPAVRERLIAATPEPYASALRDATPDARIANDVRSFAHIIAAESERPVGRIATNFTRDGDADTSVGRLIADAQLAATAAPDKGGAEIAFMNPGGIRADLRCRPEPPCTVDFGTVFTVQPFGNGLVTIGLTGAQLKTLLESQQKVSSKERTVLQPSAGFAYTWQGGAAPGMRVRDMTLLGEPIDAEREYRVTVNSFLAQSGDGLAVLQSAKVLASGGQDIDALIDYLSQSSVPTPATVPRIQWLGY